MMENAKKLLMNEEEKDELISNLTEELSMLRIKAGVSQDALASFIGVSRQTYGAIERKVRKMTWNTYLSLILFYDYNNKTHDILRSSKAFPEEIMKKIGDGSDGIEVDVSGFFGESTQNIISKLDEQALSSIRTMIMVEYARCTNTPGSVIIKSFDGMSFTGAMEKVDSGTMRALKKIKESKQAEL